jgi:hypothetical protein
MQSATAAKSVIRLKPVMMHGGDSNKVLDSFFHFLSSQLYAFREELQLLQARNTQLINNFFKTSVELGAASQHQPQAQTAGYFDFVIFLGILFPRFTKKKPESSNCSEVVTWRINQITFSDMVKHHYGVQNEPKH